MTMTTQYDLLASRNALALLQFTWIAFHIAYSSDDEALEVFTVEQLLDGWEILKSWKAKLGFKWLDTFFLSSSDPSIKKCKVLSSAWPTFYTHLDGIFRTHNKSNKIILHALPNHFKRLPYDGSFHAISMELKKTIGNHVPFVWCSSAVCDSKTVPPIQI